MPPGLENPTTRRKWMGATILAGGALAATVGGVELLKFRRPAEGKYPLQGAKLIGAVPFDNEGHAPLDTLFGDELDGRLLTDLSHLDPGQPVTSTSQFYVRTRASRLLPSNRPWFIRAPQAPGAKQIAMREP